MKTVEVAVAVIVADGGRRVLVSQRAHGVHLAGKWEFPGGKLEAGETARQALQREIFEELGVDVVAVTPILTLPYQYPEKQVRLHVFRVDQYHGQPSGRENQPLRFAPVDELLPEQFPGANLPIIRWLQLPDYYFISPQPEADDVAAYLRMMEGALRARPCLMQFRAPALSESDYLDMAQRLLPMCQSLRRPMLLNCAVETFEKTSAAGLHLSAQRAGRFESRPIARDRLLACSCHNSAELEHAARLEADFVVLSLVKASRSHPSAPLLGWSGFARLSAGRPFAVYALGGMQVDDLPQARQHGARGIAGISAFMGDTA